MGTLRRLKELITQSRDWATVERGRKLWPLVREVVQNTLNAESGLFIYRKQTPPEEIKLKVYQPWGLNYSASELTEFTNNSAWLSGGTYVCSERWFPVTECPPVRIDQRKNNVLLVYLKLLSD
ncbi:hypothetical protein GCM10025859_65380 [Alicyclobacillus fastidiosus]|nr:hypothetical protein GCM10025859_65380 [Alicyclobacillus fastidiosus]